jgi:hypothetical protein
MDETCFNVNEEPGEVITEEVTKIFHNATETGEAATELVILSHKLIISLSTILQQTQTHSFVFDTRKPLSCHLKL